MVVPYGTTTEWDVQQRVHQNFLNGQMRYNTSDNQVQVYYNGWSLVTGICRSRYWKSI